MLNKNKILYLARPNIITNPGGDTVQIVKKIEGLKKYGIQVDLNPEIIDCGKYDLAHLFNFSTELYNFINCYKQYKTVVNKLPMVLEPVYWNWRKSDLISVYGEFMGWLSLKQFGREGIIGRYLREYKDNYKHIPGGRILPLRIEMLKNVQCVFPNSQAEADYISKIFKIKYKYKVIYNGVDKPIVLPTTDQFYKKYSINNYILCVGTVYPRKNQYRLLKAVKDMGHPVVLIGPSWVEYLKACKRVMPNVCCLPRITNKELINSAYAGAIVHVLPSFYETPGLVSLEAAMAGCKVVTTDIGSAREYFGDDAWYCEPQVVSIKSAVEKAIAGKVNPELLNKLYNEFSWDSSIRKTVETYQEI